jgi:hypothetical protein
MLTEENYLIKRGTHQKEIADLASRYEVLALKLANGEKHGKDKRSVEDEMAECRLRTETAQRAIDALDAAWKRAQVLRDERLVAEAIEERRIALQSANSAVHGHAMAAAKVDEAIGKLGVAFRKLLDSETAVIRAFDRGADRVERDQIRNVFMTGQVTEISVRGALYRIVPEIIGHGAHMDPHTATGRSLADAATLRDERVTSYIDRLIAEIDDPVAASSNTHPTQAR